MPNRGGNRLEAIVIALSLALLTLTLRTLLIDGTGVLPHDNYYWCYPIFHFFAEGLTQGRLPLWNPFLHGGEPFYPLLGQVRLWDPIALLTPLVARFFTSDTVVWFNWTRYLQSLAMAAGAYLVLRPLARLPWVRLTLFPLLLFSSFVLGTFPQDGILAAFAWVPYVWWFGLRLLHRKGSPWVNWPGLGLAVGLAWQSYHFAGTWIFLIVSAGALTALHRRWWRRVFRGNWKRPALFATALVGLMALPNFALFLESGRFVYPLRMAPENFRTLAPYGGPIRIEGDPSFVTFGWWMPMDFVRFTGGSSQPWDLLQMVAPDGNPATHGNPKGGWGEPSESYLYFGLIPWLLGIFGLCLGRQRKRTLALSVTIFFGLLMLGFHGGLYPLLRPLLPPLWGLRNTGLLVLFFEMGFLYFYLVGAEGMFGRKAPARPLGLWLFLSVVVLQLLVALCLATGPGWLALRWTWALALPLLFALFWKRAAPVFLATALVLDMAGHVVRSPLLRRGVQHPGTALGLATTPTAPRFPETRYVAPEQRRLPGRPPVRYYPLLDHKAYAFSDPVRRDPTADPLLDVWQGTRWNSFLLTRDYYDWVYGTKDLAALREGFAIGKPLIGIEGGTARVVRYDHDSLDAEVSSPGGTLVWHDGFDAQWTAEVDGLAVPIVKTNNAKSIAVPAGKHQVRFVYRPLLFLACLAAFLAALALGLTSMAFSTLRRPAIIPSWRALPDSTV